MCPRCVDPLRATQLGVHFRKNPDPNAPPQSTTVNEVRTRMGVCCWPTPHSCSSASTVMVTQSARRRDVSESTRIKPDGTKALIRAERLGELPWEASSAVPRGTRDVQTSKQIFCCKLQISYVCSILRHPQKRHTKSAPRARVGPVSGSRRPDFPFRRELRLTIGAPGSFSSR